MNLTIYQHKKMKKLFLASLILFVQLTFAQSTGTPVANKPSGGTLTLGSSSLFNVNQTTAGQTITIPTPSGTIYQIEVANVGSVPFTLVPGGLLDTAKFMRLRWIGSSSGSITNKWVYAGGGSVSGGGGSGTVTSITGGYGLIGGTITDNGTFKVDTSSANSIATSYDVLVVQSDITNHKNNTSNPHSVTKTQVGLGNVDNTSDANKPVSTSQAAADALRVLANTAITGGTFTKGTVDSKGLITSYTNATTADINPSTNRNYVTDAQQTVIGNTSGTNTGDQTNISGNAATATNVALSGITGLGTGVSTFLATPSSTNLSSALTDETGTGNLVFSNSPSLVTPILGTPQSGNLSNCTGYTGNAGTATTLQTARTIDGVSFNGSANITVIAPATDAATSKTTPVDADEFPLANSATSFTLAKLTWANLKATLLTYFNSSYQPINSQSNISASAIDWNFTHLYKTLSANTTFTFSNLADGKTIVVAITNTASNYTVTWPTVDWGSAGTPVQRIGAVTDIYTFVRINGTIYGSARQ